MKEVLVGEYYKHYKGGLYKIISLATHSETNEILVIYKHTRDLSIYARPLTMWFDYIKEYNCDRFTLIDI